MPDLSQRSNAIEIMDDLNCSGEVVDQTLRELETINTLLGGNHVTLDGIAKLIAHIPKHQVISIADLGCGGGDILRLIRRWGRKQNRDFKLIGIDANPNIIEFAKMNTKASDQIAYRAIDIFSDEFAQLKFDIVTATLFFHHFSDQQLTDFLRQLKDQVNVGFVINDIHRTHFGYHAIKWLTKTFSRSAMVKFDAPLSVRRAFRKKELVAILNAAEIKNYTVRWMWAFRWQVVAKAQ